MKNRSRRLGRFEVPGWVAVTFVVLMWLMVANVLIWIFKK